MKHTERVSKVNHVIRFVAGATVCLLATIPVVRKLLILTMQEERTL